MSRPAPTTGASATAAPTTSRRISPQEWISDYFSPVVSVLSSQDLDALLGSKNNLSFTELLQPFSKLLTDVTLKDPEGANHAVPTLNVQFQDFHKDPTRMFNQKLLSDMVAEKHDEPLVAKTFQGGEVILEAPGFTPWFDVWMKAYLHAIPAVEHEFVRHHVGVVFAVSSRCTDPMAAFKTLGDTHHRKQHEKPHAYPQFMAPAVLKYYVLVLDAYGDKAEEAKAQETFTAMQTAFGSTICHFLTINSRKEDEVGGSPGLWEHWLNRGHRFCNVEARQEGMGLLPVTSTATVPEKAKEKPPPPATEAAAPLSHPLAMADEKERELQTPSPPPPPSSYLKPVTPQNIATHLSTNDVDRIRILVREFCIKALLPHVERQMRALQDTVTNRKSRSLFSGAKRWFGQGKGAASGTSVVYGKEAPELQIRKLADLYFMFKIYKNAYSFYHSIKKDFYSDEAWNYYAGAAEMASLSQFMQGDPSKKNPNHYIEDGIVKYMQVCQMPEFAVRATLFDAMCLKYQGLFQEAASSYMRMTNETKELRSSLLLEQASYCFLLATPPSIRKYAFHIILSAYRFSKIGQKRHSSRAYRQGFQLYRDHGWALSEDHILYTLGHQSLLLKEHRTAAKLFNELLAMRVPNLNSLQQMCHLREFFIVHHLREKEDKDKPKQQLPGNAAMITIPRFRAQDLVLDLSSDPRTYDALKVLNPRTTWQALERTIMERISGNEIMVLSRSCQLLYTPVSLNNLVPQAVIGEQVQILLPVKNIFQTTLIMKKIHILWKFSSDDQSEPITNASPNADQFVHTDVVDAITLEKNTEINLMLSLTILQSGELNLTGVEYGLKAQFPQTESTDYTIRGRQELFVRGPRLTATKVHKTSVVYGEDNRLRLAVQRAQPQVKMCFQVPDVLFQGQLKPLEILIQNSGDLPVANIFLVCMTPGVVSFGKSEARGKNSQGIFDFPVVDENSLALPQENGSVTRRPLDFLRVPLEGSDSELAVGATIKRKLWLRAPEQIGVNKLVFYFYYEKAEAEPVSKKARKPLYRILTKESQLHVLPSLAVSAAENKACFFDNENGSSAVVHLSHLGRAAAAQSSSTKPEGTKASLDDVAVTQISLVSNRKTLSLVQSSNELNWVIAKGESASINFKMVENSESGGNKILSSSVSGKKMSVNSPAVHQAPHVDFLKPHFAFRNIKEPPELDHDLIVLLWSSLKDPSIHGQIAAALKPQTPKVIPKGDETDGRSSMDHEVKKEVPMTAVHSVKATLSTPDQLQHDFTASPLCLVSCKLHVTNTADKEMLFSVQAEGEQFVGSVESDVVIKGGEEWECSLMMAVTMPGLHRVDGIKFKVSFIGVKKNAKKEDVLVPLEASVLVSQA